MFYACSSVFVQIVKLGFVEFSVESCCDSVTVYDGDSRSAPLLGTFRGNTLPRNVFSTNNTMLVYFESDGSGTWNGFEINYTTLPLATGKALVGTCLNAYNQRSLFVQFATKRNYVKCYRVFLDAFICGPSFIRKLN